MVTQTKFLNSNPLHQHKDPLLRQSFLESAFQGTLTLLGAFTCTVSHLRRIPRPVIVIDKDNKDYAGVLLYLNYIAITAGSS